MTFAVKGIGQSFTYQCYYRLLEGGWKKVTNAGAETATFTITAQVKNNDNQYRGCIYDGFGKSDKITSGYADREK